MSSNSSLEKVVDNDNDNILSQSHEQFLVQKYGTTDLDPIPSDDPKQPLNWSPRLKTAYLILNAVSIMSVTFFQAGLSPGFASFSKMYGVSMTEASYLTTAQIVTAGVFPLLFVPLMNTYGRKVFQVGGMACVLVFNIAGAYCKTYGQQMATRVMLAFFQLVHYGTGAMIVADLFFAKDRPRRNGLWTMFLTVGTMLGPFILGFIVQHSGIRWMFHFYAILSGVLVLFWCAAPETLYVPGEPIRNWRLRRASFDWKQIFRPFRQFRSFRILWTILAISFSFAYGNISLIVMIPASMGALFNLNAQQVSYQYLSLMIGAVLGELIAIPLSNYQIRLIKERRGHTKIVDRLWQAYVGYILLIMGLIVWGVMMSQSEPGHWTIKPLIGAAFTVGGCQISMTIMTAYIMDLDPENEGDTGLVLTLFRQTIGFTGPLYFNKLFAELGFAKASYVMCGVIGFFWLGMVVIHFHGLKEKQSVGHEKGEIDV